MAVYDAQELAGMRRCISRDSSEIPWSKAEINAMLQALEDWWETTAKLDAAAAMEAAAPGKTTNAAKKTIGKWWLEHKFKLGG